MSGRNEDEKLRLLPVEQGRNYLEQSKEEKLLQGKVPLELAEKDLENSTSEEDDDKSGTNLATAFILMLVFSLCNRIFGRLQTYPMHNYPLFMTLMSVFIYVPICYFYIIPVLCWGNSITQEQRTIPKYKFAIMGGYDSLAGIMQTFAINYISNASMIVLVQQSAIPISMLISKYALNSTYTREQYIGAGIVLFGIVVVLIPNFICPSPVSASDGIMPAEASPLMQLIGLLVLVISCIPMCLSSVYKEKALGEVDIDIIYLNGWVAVFQFLIAIPLCLPTSQVQNIPIEEIIPHMRNGFKCYLGINSITPENNPYNQPLDDCASAPIFVNTYLFFNVIYNFLIVVILKLGSANILYMASTVIVPLSNVVFSLKFIPGNQPLRTWDIIGLFVIMTGLVIYRFNKELLQCWKQLRGEKIIDENKELEKRHAKKILKDAERKQLKYLGLNQIESLTTLVDVRLMKEKTRLLFRSPQQIRSHLYTKIGIPPSPLISMGPGNRFGITDKEAFSIARANYNATGLSPNVYTTTLERTSSFRSNSSSKPSSNTSSYLTKNNLFPPNNTTKISNTFSYGTDGRNSSSSTGSKLPNIIKKT